MKGKVVKPGKSSVEVDGHAGKGVADNREEASRYRVVQAMADNSEQAKTLKEYQAMADRQTGLPSELKTGIQNLSGVSMDDVNVHYDSSQPAQLHALAYTQGSTIHIAPGQEKHLPHEAWHVVQQKQGRVEATTQLKGTGINDDAALEKEADEMGQKATVIGAATSGAENGSVPTSHTLDRSAPVQRKVGFEFQAYNSVIFTSSGEIKKSLGRGAEFDVESDCGAQSKELEIVTDAVEETTAGRKQLEQQMAAIESFVGKIPAAAKRNEEINTIDGIQWKPHAKGVVFSIINPMSFHPQSTVGVKFTRIAELIDVFSSAPFTAGTKVTEKGYPGATTETGELLEKVGWSAKEDQRPFREAMRKGLNEARRDFKEESPRLISIAAMLYGFAEVARMQIIPDDHSYIKYFMPFMLRLGLLPHYKSLSKTEKETLRSKTSKDVKSAPFFPNADEYDYSKDRPLSDLLDELESGRDFAGPVGYAYATPGSLGMKNDSDIGSSDEEETRKGAVIELRKLGADVAPDQLGAFALAVFDLIRLINKGHEDEELDVEDEAPAMTQVQRNNRGNDDTGCKCKCFLTTACTSARGLPDDCAELTTLRWFRDHYMTTLPEGQELIRLYYRVAPVIVERIELHRRRKAILDGLYRIITLCVEAIKEKRFEFALEMYGMAVAVLSAKFVRKTPDSFGAF